MKYDYWAVTLTCHHGNYAGLVDIGERAQLSNSKDGLHVGCATGFPKLTDLIIHGCKWNRDILPINAF